MTVGIAAACETESAVPKIVVAADRMVTTGHTTKIEHEHTKAKLKSVYDEDGISCMAVTAGDVGIAESFFQNMEEILEDSRVSTTEDLIEAGVDAHHNIVRETINRQVLSQMGVTLEEFTSGEVDLADSTEQALLGDIASQREEIVNNLNVMLAAVDGLEYQICTIPNGDVARHNRIGYHAIGSGTEPARTEFIRSRYDSESDIEDALLKVVEAKRQSEEARGVGERIDIGVVSAERCHHFSSEDAEPLIALQEEIEESQAEVRQKVIEDTEYTYRQEQ